jgi:predicted ATP-dependent serine protease
MSTTIKERTTWICDNCRADTAAERKRCADCGTSRY